MDMDSYQKIKKIKLITLQISTLHFTNQFCHVTQNTTLSATKTQHPDILCPVAIFNIARQHLQLGIWFKCLSADKNHENNYQKCEKADNLSLVLLQESVCLLTIFQQAPSMKSAGKQPETPHTISLRATQVQIPHSDEHWSFPQRHVGDLHK